MKKLILVLLFISTVVIGLNFQGHQSLVNLGTTALFTAPASGRYFINGQLLLPNAITPNGGLSRVVASVSKNGTTLLYYGVPGATGFQIPSVQLVSNDAVSVAITSNASVDQGLNKVKGDVFFGSKF